MRIGFGYDSHRMEAGRRLVLGGVEIPHHSGPVAHSDGDAAVHSLIDALFGAAGMGDIGAHFPDTDEKYRDASSMDLLAEAVRLVQEAGWRVVNADSTLICQEPRLSPYRERIVESVSAVLGAGAGSFSFKAKTAEGLGPAGGGEAIEAYSVCLMEEV